MKKDELNERNDETGQVDQHDSILSEESESGGMVKALIARARGWIAR